MTLPPINDHAQEAKLGNMLPRETRKFKKMKVKKEGLDRLQKWKSEMPTQLTEPNLPYMFIQDLKLHNISTMGNCCGETIKRSESYNKSTVVPQNAIRVAESEADAQYMDQVIFENEDLFLISGNDLKEVLHRSIGALTFLNAHKKRGVGSGVLISKDLILTAAHNIFNHQLRQENTNFKFYIGVDGVAEEYHQIEGWRYPEGFRTCSQMKKMEFDYAVMKLKKPIDFDKYLSLSLLCPICLPKDKEKYLKIFGFPSITPSNPSVLYKNNFAYADKSGKKMTLFQYGLQLQDRIVEIDALEFKIGYGISTLPGQSGCPVVVDNSIIAIHTGGDQRKKCNVGRIVDEGFIRSIKDWTVQLKAGLFTLSENDICQHISSALKKLSKMMKQPLILHKKQPNRNETNDIIGSMTKEAKTQQNHKNSNGSSSSRPAKTNPETKLSLPKQSLKSVDLSEYTNLLQLDLRDNSLEAIDLSHCPLLNKLILHNNQLRSVDTKANINLTQLYLRYNQLSAIDMSKNINLTHLHLSQNQLSAMDVSNNINLIWLNLCYNQLSAMDVSSNINLTHLDLRSNKLSAIDVSKNINLTRLDLPSNQLSTMDVSCNIKLTWLVLSKNQLSAMDVSNNINLTRLDLSSNQLSAIDMSKNINLTHLHLSQNQLSAMDVSNNIKLTYLHLSYNQLSAMDVSSNINLTHLDLRSNKLSAIDVSKNINLTRLDLPSNQLSAINLSANSNLQWLWLHQNKIAEIDLSRNTKLHTLFIQENRLVRISLAVAGNDYTGSFDLSDQQSAACRVELRCEEADQGKAIRIVDEWGKKYSQQNKNKHACAYSYQVL